MTDAERMVAGDDEEKVRREHEELFARAAAIVRGDQGEVERWDAAIGQSRVSTLVALLGRLSITSRWAGGDVIDVSPVTIERATALRDQVRAEIDRRLVNQQLDAVDRLERAATFVAWVGVGLAVTTALIGIPSAVQAWTGLGWWWPW